MLWIYGMKSWNFHTRGRGRLFEIIGELPNSSVSPEDDEASSDEINMLFLDRKGLLLSKQQGSTFIRNYLGGAIFDTDITINGVDYKFYYEDKPFDYSVYTKVPKLSAERFLASTVSKSFWSRFLDFFQKLLENSYHNTHPDHKFPALSCQRTKLIPLAYIFMS